MKKIMFLAAAAMILGACEQEKFANKTIESAEGFIELTATHEAVTSAAEEVPVRTTLEEAGAVNWAAGDQIKLVWNGGDATSDALAQAGASATFSFSATPGEGNVYAVYPAAIVSSYDGTDFKVTVPAIQDGSFASAAIEVAEISGSSISFKNLGSIIKLTVTEPAVRSIVIGNYNLKNAIVGTVPVTFTDGIPAAGKVTDGSTELILNVPGPGTYYAATLPVQMGNGFYVEFFDAENGAGKMLDKTLSLKDFNPGRSGMLNIGTIIDTEVLADWYFNSPAAATMMTNWCSGTLDDNAVVTLTDKVGDTGQYILSKDLKSKMVFTQVDKTSIGTWADLALFSTGQPGFNKIWLGDAFEFDVDNENVLPVNTNLRMCFILRLPKGQLGGFTVEYYSGNTWYTLDDPAHPLEFKTVSEVEYSYNILKTGNNNQDLITFNFPLKHEIPAHGLKIRIRASVPYTCEGKALAAPANAKSRFRGENNAGCPSPLIEIVK